MIVECVIEKSTNPDRPAGSSASWIVNLKHDASLGHIKGFIAAANGIDPGDGNRVNTEVTEEVCEYCVGDDNPLEGKRLHLEAVNIRTRSGGDFTVHRWAPLD
jgi:hypothetical protein